MKYVIKPIYVNGYELIFFVFIAQIGLCLKKSIKKIALFKITNEN